MRINSSVTRHPSFQRAASLLLLLPLALLTAPRLEAAEPPTQAERIRIGSYNLEFFDKGGPVEIAEMLQTRQFDLIAIQEIPRKEGYASTDDLRNALNAVEKQAGIGVTWHCCEGKIGSGDDARKFKSILSRTPLTESTELDLHAGDWHGGSAVRAKTRIGNTTISLYSLHMPGIPGNKQKLVDHPTLKADDADLVLLVGDFNEQLEGPGDKILRKAGFVPSWTALNFDLRGKKTYHALQADNDYGVIDHIYLRSSRRAQFVAGGIIELKKPLADHHPIWTEISFKPGK